jgi:LacI family transcriptional regulator
VRPPTLRDVASQAGVHPATASRALNPETRSLVNAETASRVIKVAKSLGYRPNPIARSLKTARSATIGLMVPDLTNPLFPPIVRGVERVLSPVGYSAWIVNTDNDLERERAQVQSLMSRQVEGFIIATARLEHPLLEQLHAEGVPMVLVNRRLADGNVPSVTPDDAAGAAMAVAHLASLGHTRIAHLAGPQDTSTGVVRLRAYREALAAHGLEHDPDLVAVCASWTEVEGAVGLRELLDRGVEFTAVLGGNDMLALGCYDVLEERGLLCPQDLSVVGFNDVPFVDKLRPPLTSIREPHEEMGVEAAHLLLDMLKNPGRHPRSVLLPPTIAVRQSTSGPREPG